MNGITVFSSRRRQSRSKTSIGALPSRGKMNKSAARSHKKYRGQGR